MWIDYNEKYEVSSDGHIRNKKSGRILHEFINKNGYLITQFDGKTRTVHRVVASVYLDNPNKCEDINHKDGNKRNNSVENLEWCTRSENLKHAYKLELKISKGEKNGNHKLSKEDVEYIVSIYKKGDAKYGAKALAKSSMLHLRQFVRSSPDKIGNDEWRDFCKWVEGLPYSELITMEGLE